MQGTQYATKRSILCMGAFCGPTKLLYVSVVFYRLESLSANKILNNVKINEIY